MPYSMKRKFPQAVAKAILQQNHLTSDTYVIVIVGITCDVMTLVKPTILELQGTTAVSNTSHTNTTDCRHILVHDKSFHTVRKTLLKSLAPWVHALPTILVTPPPLMASLLHRLTRNYSSRQMTMMPTFEQSYGSFDKHDDTDEIFYHPPTNRSFTAYTAAAKHAMPKDPASDDTVTTHPETI